MNAQPPQSFSSVLARALLAHSVYENGYEGGTATVARLTVTPRSCTLEDNGRGIGLHREGYVEGLVQQLGAQGGKVALHGLGLALISISTPSLAIESRREGRRFTQQFAWGVAQGGVEVSPWDGPSGTHITFTLPDSAPDIDLAEVAGQAGLWARTHPGLAIELNGSRIAP